jgi:S-DNA-T family DNA segregation ATPase FtsK/SpoIIIE
MSRLDQIRAGMVSRPGVGPTPAETSAETPPATASAASVVTPDVPAAATSDATAAIRPTPPAVATPVSATEPDAVPSAAASEATSAPASRIRPFTPAATPPAGAAPGASAPAFNPVRNGDPEPRPATPAITLPEAPPHAPPVVQASSAYTSRQRKVYSVPDYRGLLKPGSEQEFDRESLVKRARVIEETLQSFGAPGRVVEINTGPVITQFGIEPGYLTARGGNKSRVKVSAIAQLDKDLQLALGAKAIRVEAPVPGKGFVGIEVPNDEAATVSLRDVMESREFTRIKSPLAIALGQSVDGAPVAADLTSMPHLLIAGTTGSGKSVCVNAIIASLILRNSPEIVKFIMVDPKRVELTGYNGIPHLVAPVVVELERIVGVLKWVTREMDERYKKFSNAGARNIVDYNNHLPSTDEPMPYIVVIIDELADLMMLAPDETERVITRIAALARATGIHLVIATQRPSVDVVTGLIKANFPARIAFAVASGIDSRVILDQPGAERLLGRGDMLYMSGDAPAPRRLQGVFVSDQEINNMTRYWRQQQLDAPQRPITALLDEDSPALGASSAPARSAAPAITPARPAATASPPPAPARATLWEDDDDEAGDADDGGLREDGEDEMYDEAVELVRRLGKASVSLLQRRLRIGYTRAARLIDLMEERGVVGPATEGSKPRDVLPMR